MDKRFWTAFGLGGLTSLGIFYVYEVVTYRKLHKESCNITTKAYKTLKETLIKDPEFAEYYKKENPKLYKKIMESK